MYTSLLSIIKTNYPLTSFLRDKVTFLRIRNIYAKEKEMQEILSGSENSRAFKTFYLVVFYLRKLRKYNTGFLNPFLYQVTNLNKLSFLGCNSRASFQHFFLKTGGYHSTKVKEHYNSAQGLQSQRNWLSLFLRFG